MTDSTQSFFILGTVTGVENLTSAKGNSFINFTLMDANKTSFEIALFGNLMSMAGNVIVGKKVKVTCALKSREYKDKNGKTRYGLTIETYMIEPIGKPEIDKSEIDSIPF